MKYFLSPIIVKEIVSWSKNTGENVVVFEPLSKAISQIGQAFYPSEEKQADSLQKTFLFWCMSDEFAELLSQASEKANSVSLELARQSMSEYSQSESFVAGVPIDDALSAFAALLRADLRTKDARASVRLDELYIWQGFSRAFDLHDITLLLLASCASKDVLASFDKLISIKSNPRDLLQISENEFGAKQNPAFSSALRMFSLANFEAAQTGFARCVESDPGSAAYVLALALSLSMNYEATAADFDQALSLLESCAALEGSRLLESVRFLIYRLRGQSGELPNHDDPVTYFIHIYALLLDRRYDEVSKLTVSHLANFPDDILALLCQSTADLMQIQEAYYDDPPLPNAELLPYRTQLERVQTGLNRVLELTEALHLPALKVRALLDLSLSKLFERDFQACIRCCQSAISIEEDCPEAKLNMAISNIALGNLPAALASLKGSPQRFALICSRLAAEAYFHACAFDDALKIWSSILDNEPERLWRLRIAYRMLESYRLLQDSANGQKCVDILLKEFQTEPETVLALAFELWQLNRTEEAILSLKRAKTYASPNLAKWIAWELARLLMADGKVLAATDEYTSISSETIDSVQAREFASALFKANLKPAAYKWARKLRELRGEVIPGITEIETDYLVENGDLESAKDLLVQLSQKRPMSVMNRLATAKIFAALEQETMALSMLDEIDRLNLSEEMKKEISQLRRDLQLIISAKQEST